MAKSRRDHTEEHIERIGALFQKISQSAFVIKSSPFQNRLRNLLSSHYHIESAEGIWPKVLNFTYKLYSPLRMNSVDKTFSNIFYLIIVGMFQVLFGLIGIIICFSIFRPMNSVPASGPLELSTIITSTILILLPIYFLLATFHKWYVFANDKYYPGFVKAILVIGWFCILLYVLLLPANWSSGRISDKPGT